ncbi:hypothetical protein RclHR1_05020013 [Rhizophagus clarus]|uniref:HMG box domain-containing protein n=1 Tax=Rhizophagus clarus TaxID=94130 RepID=A0A2Z6RKG1_9GLOM|nr:hypothetical protein RclHR1_05020013 [Rhizophagus clarus]GET04296.1 hypothetical protein GLOIN_2v1572975 [Rhizophagus clarus]
MPKSNSKSYLNDKPQTPNSFTPPSTFSNSQTSSFQTLMSYYTPSVTSGPPYNLTLSLPVLLLPKLKSNGSPEKPQSAFTLFLMDYVAKVKHQNQQLTLGEITYFASKEWKYQPSHVIRFFEVLSMAAKELHEKYHPKRKYAKIKNHENKKESIINHTIKNNTINNPINNTTKNTIKNTTINTTTNNNSIPIITPTSVDSFPNFDIDFELYDKPKEDEIFFPLFP